MTTNITDLGHLTDLLGSECSDADVEIARDNLIAAGLLHWENDFEGGVLTGTDAEFYAAAFGGAV